jgi:hypothetical protein
LSISLLHAIYDPNVAAITADVTLTPILTNGDVLKVTDIDPHVGVLPVPVAASIASDGTLKLRNAPDVGGAGTYAPVRLLGNSSSLNLHCGTGVHGHHHPDRQIAYNVGDRRSAVHRRQPVQRISDSPVLGCEHCCHSHHGDPSIVRRAGRYAHRRGALAGDLMNSLPANIT